MDKSNTAMALAPIILIIAGTDSSGGAGVARDIATAACSGVSPALAITSVTAQTHDKVLHIEPVAPWLIAQQIASAFDANTISAVKIGMLGTAETAKTVAAMLKKYNPMPPVIFDPVLAASSKGSLARGNMRGAIIHDLLPLTTLVTPNLAELAELNRTAPATHDTEARAQGEALIRLGTHAVLIKGGHAKGPMATDYLLMKNHTPVSFSQKRLETTMRGTGCTLSTAIAANLAQGLALDAAIEKAKQHVFDLLESKTRK